MLRAASEHLEKISQIIEKQKGKYLPLALLIRMLRFPVIMMIYANHPPLGSLITGFKRKRDIRRTPEFQHSSLSCS